MQRFISWRNFSLLIAFADLWRVRVYDHGVWYVLFADGLALVFINFPKEIDALTFGQWVPDAGKINAHTPPFLIAGFGWLVLSAVTAVLFFTDWLKIPAAH
jgi:hypothetical protein